MIKWISVNEKLPEVIPFPKHENHGHGLARSKPVLVYVKKGRHTGYGVSLTTFETFDYDRKGSFYGDNSLITHWAEFNFPEEDTKAGTL